MDSAERGRPDGLEALEPVGDPVCWLARVCPECGRLAEGDAAEVCTMCGADLDRP